MVYRCNEIVFITRPLTQNFGHYLRPICAMTGSARIDDRARMQHQPLLAQQSVDLRKHLFPKIHGTAADRTAFLPSPHPTDRTTAAKSASEATSRLRKADVPFSLPARTAQSIPPVHQKRA